jgi:Glutamyl- and glutaminyl-tRNA synthetases
VRNSLADAQVLHGWDAEQLLTALQPLWQQEGWSLPGNDGSWAKDLVTLLGPSLTLVNDGVEQARPFFEEPALESDGLQQLDQDGARAALQALNSLLEASPWDGTDNGRGQELLKQAAEQAGVKKGLMMKSLRAALLGRLQGPDLMTTWGLLARIGHDRQRIHRCC